MFPILKACKLGDLDNLKHLIKYGMDAEKVFGILAENGHIIDYVNSEINTQEYNYALHAASRTGHLNIVKYAVELGANIRSNENHALKVACRFGHLEIVKFLVSHGANVRTCYDYPLQVAAQNGYLDIVKYLVVNGANHRTSDDYAVRWASYNGHLETIKYLVEQGSPIARISDIGRQYISFCNKMEIKSRIRAQKKIYYWWIQICYDLERECGKRMAEKNFTVYKALC